MPAKAAPKKNKSAIKRARQAEARALKNRAVKKMLKTLSKKVETAVINKNMDDANAALKKAASAIDKAANKGIIHKNTAARRVSHLKMLVNSLTPSEAG